jgi:peptide/nickel transport system substrate-binding protein
VTLGTPAVHAQKGRRTLRFVANADLTVVDPVWSTAYVVRNHEYLVYDTLFGTDEPLRIKPQMVELTVSVDGMTYTFRLRDGLRWHDGQPVQGGGLSGVAQALGQEGSLWPAPHGAYGKIAPVDQKTFTLGLAERFGPDVLSKSSSLVPDMMPARIAATPPNDPIREIVGSGPLKFAKHEWQPGNQAVYVRNPDYVPRHEARNGSTGGTRVCLETRSSGGISPPRGRGGRPRGGWDRLVGVPTARLHLED